MFDPKKHEARIAEAKAHSWKMQSCRDRPAIRAELDAIEERFRQVEGLQNQISGLKAKKDSAGTEHERVDLQYEIDDLESQAEALLFRNTTKDVLISNLLRTGPADLVMRHSMMGNTIGRYRWLVKQARDKATHRPGDAAAKIELELAQHNFDRIVQERDALYEQIINTL